MHTVQSDSTVVTPRFVAVYFQVSNPLVDGSFGYQSGRHGASVLSKFALHLPTPRC